MFHQELNFDAIKEIALAEHIQKHGSGRKPLPNVGFVDFATAFDVFFQKLGFEYLEPAV
jgi:hypothetical protein